MEVVEVAPAYDVSDITSLLAVRAMLDVLATLVDAGHLPRKDRGAGIVPGEKQPWAV
jgi:agmatinase